MDMSLSINTHRIEYLAYKARLLAGSKQLCGDIHAWSASAEEMLLDLADALRRLLSVPPEDEEALLAKGWRRCAVGQRTSQWCAAAESMRAQDTELLREALDALETGSAEGCSRTAQAIRRRLALQACGSSA